jgi:RNA polymerase sigma-70 factor, ECF subfamily
VSRYLPSGSAGLPQPALLDSVNETHAPIADTDGDMSLVSRAIRHAKAGDTSALHFLYARYADDVFAYVMSIVRDYHDAEDITQSVFAKLMKAISKYEQREVPFTAWILRVARNAALDHLRARRQYPCGDIRALSRTDDYVNLERSESLRAALDQLSEDQREVLVLRHIVGYSPGEIARRLNKTEGSIYGLHHRAQVALQAALASLEATPVTAPQEDDSVKAAAQ